MSKRKHRRLKHKSLRCGVAKPETVKKPTTLMWAYGSNLSHRQMRLRCPRAKPVGPLCLEGGVLTFRGYADVESRDGCVIAGGLWRITPRCERELDAYEGVSAGIYEKRYLLLRMPDGREEKCLYYKMLPQNGELGVMPPWAQYLDVIRDGYKDFKLNTRYLDEALARAWGEKDKTADVLDRWKRKGRPRLVRITEANGETVQ
jgi:hypothetical protein